MTRLTDERIASLARQYLGTCKRVFYTKWKDGIDIEYPTLEVEQFARAIEAELSKQVPVAQYTEGHCENKRKPGGCPLHNLHCGYPKCDRKATAPLPSAPDTVQVPREPTPEEKIAAKAEYDRN